MRQIPLFITALLLTVTASAMRPGQGPNKGALAVASVANTSDVLFYWNADSVTSGQSPQKGVGTITVGASYTSTTAVVSNGADNNNLGNSGGKIQFSTWTASGFNIDMSKGRIGFYCYLRETGASSDGDPVYGGGATSGQKFYWQNVSGTNSWCYKDKAVTFTPTANAWIFVELAWDSAETTLGRPCQVFIDGASVSQCTTGSTGALPAATDIRLGGVDGNALSMIYDQFIISNDPNRDLNALKNQTSF